MRARRTREGGAVAAEFVLLLPVLLTIVLGAIDWGWYFSVRGVAINAARHGARVGSLLGNTAAVQGVAAATTALNSVPGCVASAPRPTILQGVRISVTCSTVVLTNFFPAALIPRSLTIAAEIRHE